MSALKKISKSAHWKKVSVDNGASKYAMKEDTRVEGPWEMGEKPMKRNSKEDWEQIFEEAKTGNFDKIPAEIKVRHYHSLKAIAKDNVEPERRTYPRKCFWYWGNTGLGKTRDAFA